MRVRQLAIFLLCLTAFALAGCANNRRYNDRYAGGPGYGSVYGQRGVYNSGDYRWEQQQQQRERQKIRRMERRQERLQRQRERNRERHDNRNRYERRRY